MLKCFWLDGISWYLSKYNHFWVLGKPQVETNRENGMSFVLHSSVVQYKLPQGYFVRELELFLTYALDEVAFGIFYF